MQVVEIYERHFKSRAGPREPSSPSKGFRLQNFGLKTGPIKMQLVINI
jgi:hypothetical protein